MIKKETFNLRLGLMGFALLLLGSYFDNLRGPLLPKLAQEFGLSYDNQSVLLALGSLGALFCTFSLMPILNRFSMRDVTCAILGVTGLGAICVVFVSNFHGLVLLALMIGILVSQLGTCSNLFVQKATAPAYQGKMLSFLHVMYGIGSFIAPLIVGYVLEKTTYSWRILFIGAVPIVVVMLLQVIIGFKRIPPEHKTRDIPQSIKLNTHQMLIVVIMCLYVCGEVLTSMWMVSYLQNVYKLSQIESGNYQSLFFVMMAATRLACFLFVPKEWSLRILTTCLTLSALSFTAAIYFNWPLGISLIGFLGPFFPIYIARAGQKFPEQWRSITIWVLSMMQLSLALAHLFLGRLAGSIGIEQAFKLPLLLLLGALFLLVITETRYRTPKTL